MRRSAVAYKGVCAIPAFILMRKCHSNLIKRLPTAAFMLIISWPQSHSFYFFFFFFLKLFQSHQWHLLSDLLNGLKVALPHQIRVQSQNVQDWVKNNRNGTLWLPAWHFGRSVSNTGVGSAAELLPVPPNIYLKKKPELL